ncbi:MAG: DinB family protein [Dehalococcoidia bacterium]
MLGREALRELYGYTEFTWNACASAVRTLPESALTRAIAGSGWPSLADTLRHIVSAYDGWLHETLAAGPVVVERIEDVTTWEQLEEWRSKTRASFLRLLEDTPDAKLLDPSTRVWKEYDGGMLMSIADVLAHVLLHERGHNGDVTTLLFQLGAEPPMTDYGVYLYVKRRREDAQRT